MTTMNLWLLSVAMLGSTLSFGQPPPGETDPFSVCVIGYDMPLSNQQPDPISQLRGLYVELADTLAKQMQTTVSEHFVLQAYFSRPVRAGLLANICRAQIGLPRTEGDWYIPKKVALTRSFLNLGYAIVVPAGQPISRLEDLQGKTVVVQSNSPAHMALSALGRVSFEYAIDAEPAMSMLADGRAQAAFIWGPVAGYLNKYKYQNRYTIIPTDMVWPVAIGVRAEDLSLRDQLNDRLAGLAAYVQQLASQYGFPTGPPLLIPESLKNPYATKQP